MKIKLFALCLIVATVCRGAALADATRQLRAKEAVQELITKLGKDKKRDEAIPVIKQVLALRFANTPDISIHQMMANKKWTILIEKMGAIVAEFRAKNSEFTSYFDLIDAAFSGRFAGEIGDDRKITQAMINEFETRASAQPSTAAASAAAAPPKAAKPSTAAAAAPAKKGFDEN